MLRRLFLMRHAEAASRGPLGDASRPLSEAGRADAERAGQTLRDAGVQLALVSSATRTRETFDALGLDARAEYMDVLYHGGTDEMAQRIREVEDDVTALLVVGHSPVIPALAAELLYATARREADHLMCHYPTATVTELVVEGPWSELGDHPVRLPDKGPRV